MADAYPVPMNLGSSSRQVSASYSSRPPRTRTCLNGKLVYGDGGFYTLDCAIRDLSEGGAKIIIPRRQAVPLDLYLIVVRNCVVHESKVVWLNFPARGLKFCKTLSLSGPLPAELQFLRKLWGDLYAQAGWDTMM